MGASTFSIFSKHPDPALAFDLAVRKAQYDHGHVGYTGTIAEKQNYVIIKLARDEPLSLPNAKDLAEELIDANDPRIDDKWGPAGAIAVGYSRGDKEHIMGWLFFGWASD